MRFLATILGVISVACAAGCSKDEASLVGSLGDFYRLDHDSIRARLYPSELAIEFVRENDEVPVRVTVRRDEQIVIGNYDLTQVGDITGRSDGVDIPRFRSGNLQLEAYDGANDSRIAGEFEASFDTGKDLAGVSGIFDTTLVVIERVDGYEVDASFPDLGARR